MLNKLRYPSLLLVVITFFVLQQTQGQVTFKPGLRGGFSLSTISEMHASYKTDFYVGGFGEINLTKRYALQPEISYIRQGSDNVARNYYESNVERVEHRDLQLGYLSFAVINKFTFGPGIQIQFGPALDVLVNNNLAKRETYNDLAFITGIAYRMPSGLTFEARFKKGALDILDSDYYYNERNDHYLFGNYNTNINFQLGLSYTFRGK